MTSYSLIRVTTLENSADKMIFIWAHPGRIRRWLGDEDKILRFRGSGTVWRDAETGRRAGVTLESLLADFEKLEEWQP